MVVLVSGNEAIIGTSNPFAGVHQHGATITAKKKILSRAITSEQAELLKAMGRRVSYNKKTATSYIVFGKQVFIPARPFVMIQNPPDVIAFNGIFHSWMDRQLATFNT